MKALARLLCARHPDCKDYRRYCKEMERQMTQDNMAVLKAKLAGVPKSKTMWLNTIAGLFIQFLPHVAETLPALYGLMPNNIYSVLLLVLVVGNIWLRFYTDKSLADK